MSPGSIMEAKNGNIVPYNGKTYMESLLLYGSHGRNKWLNQMAEQLERSLSSVNCYITIVSTRSDRNGNLLNTVIAKNILNSQ